MPSHSVILNLISPFEVSGSVALYRHKPSKYSIGAELFLSETRIMFSSFVGLPVPCTLRLVAWEPNALVPQRKVPRGPVNAAAHLTTGK